MSKEDFLNDAEVTEKEIVSRKYKNAERVKEGVVLQNEKEMDLHKNWIKELALNSKTIEKVKLEATEMVKLLMGKDLMEVILYGSCARGNYEDDSDIDIALLTKCNRIEAKKYNDSLAQISTELAMKYFVIINFVSLPYNEFIEKRTWYGYFKNIDVEGEVLYG
ncbi:MAG: nucleotidyltransferase domain-containing protein [Blautia sp.]|nr:nucleotidyltransferase domain-containing protein [Lachnoclostridium sp.]MCM1211173.1 nucleotidyltransferase domain-containing protein [Blautia sp.]